MAKFELRAGEEVIERVGIGNLTRKRGAGQMIVTDRRLVVVDSASVFWLMMFGWLGFLYAAARHSKRIHCDLRRGSLKRVELIGDRRLVLHTQGEGYAAQHIPINDLANAERWNDRLMLWNAGSAGPALLPEARLIEHR